MENFRIPQNLSIPSSSSEFSASAPSATPLRLQITDSTSTTIKPHLPTIISFGFRCSSAAILKKMGFKNESYPFDWLISDLSTIKHCLKDDFKEFLNLDNYTRKYTKTYEMADSTQGFVCDEHLMVNTFYQPKEIMDVENTYQYKLAMNHHNILEQKDKEYYTRCVQRLRELIISDKSKIYLHICRLITKEKYVKEKTEILNKLIEFDDSINSKVEDKIVSIKGIIFILVKNPNEETLSIPSSSSEFSVEAPSLTPPLLQTLSIPTSSSEFSVEAPSLTPLCLKNKITKELLYESIVTKTKIYIIFTNSYFIDAGEEFMGNYSEETEYIKNIIKENIIE